MDKIRLGLIGIGKGGRTVALSQKGLPEVELAAVAATNESKTRDAAALYGAGKYYTDFKDMLKDDEIDAVFIATPNHLHCEMTVEAARAKKHVLCEKPMALNLKDADLMIASAAKNKVKLMVGFSERFNTAFVRARAIIDSGKIGTPVMIHARRAHKPRWDDWVKNPEQSGGALVLAGVHNIDLILWLAGSTPERIYAEMGSFLYKKEKYIDNVALVMRLKNGAIASMVESYILPKGTPHPVDRRIEVIGTKGTIDVDMMKQPLTTCTDEGLTIEDTLTWPIVGDEMIGAVKEELREFARCIIEDYEPAASGDAGRLTLEVALAAHAAYEQKRVIEF